MYEDEQFIPCATETQSPRKKTHSTTLTLPPTVNKIQILSERVSYKKKMHIHCFTDNEIFLGMLWVTANQINTIIQVTQDIL